MGKLGEALGKYIDIEKVQMENIRNKQQRVKMASVSVNSSTESLQITNK